MKLGRMLSDVLISLVRAPATRRYPVQRQPAPLRLRGPVEWDRSKCTGCGVCVMDCPANALRLFTFDKASKRFVLEYHIDRCAFCGQCSESCAQNALWMSHTRWELADASREPLTVLFGLDEDVARVMAERAADESVER
jgi:formate hydrogenlyase subunit 6/NADH:ubiquinone oxidoreductase subunit I